MSAAPAAARSGPVVVFNNVRLRFDGPPVLENVSFSVAPGETRILLGPAGVGKSVLLKLVNGLLRPDEGSIRAVRRRRSRTWRSEEIFALRTRTGMVFQEGALFDSLTVRDNVAYQLIQERVPDDEIDERVHEALRFVELDGTFDLFRQHFGRHEAAGGHCAGADPAAGAAAVRLADRRSGPGDFDHHY